MTPLWRILKGALARCGLRVERTRWAPPAPPEPGQLRMSLAGCLRAAIANGVSPATVIDVGVARGTRELYEAFPEARFLLVEPLEEYEPVLRGWCGELGEAEYVLAAASGSAGTGVIHVHPDLEGSSLHTETEGGEVDGKEREIRLVTLDNLCREREASGPYVLKVDAQGHEIDVLKGAKEVLAETQMAVLEASLFRFFEGGHQLPDCIVFMKDHGFVPYDLFGPHYRPLDKAMSQVDVAFVPERSPLRACHIYATAAQREEQTRRMQNDFAAAQSE